MSGGTKIASLSALVFICLTISSIKARAQEDIILRKLKFSGGGGIGYFFNTFSNIPDFQTKSFNPSFTGKLLWEPEHLLSIGIESGFYHIRSTNFNTIKPDSEKLTTNLYAIPFFLSVAMKVTERIKINFATGWCSLIYGIKTGDSVNITKGNVYSMSNFSTGCTYFFPLMKNVDLGAELKYMYIGKTDDMHLSLMVSISYNIFTWNISKN